MFSSKPYNYQEAYITSEPVIMPPSKLGYHSNAVFQDYPPLMQDGRVVVASFQPTAVTNQSIVTENGLETNWQYRKFMIENGTQIMKENFTAAANDIGYVNRFADLQRGSYNSPYRYTSYNDERKPFGHQSSDLKDIYLSREQLNANRIIPTISRNGIHIQGRD